MIDGLVADLTPIRRVNPSQAYWRIAAAVAAAILFAAFVLEARPDLGVVILHPVFLTRTGLLLVAGLGASSAVIAMARPGVGRRDTGGRWPLALAAMMPLVAFAYAANRGSGIEGSLAVGHWLMCLVYIGLMAAVIGAAMVIWLRRGAPTAPNRAGWLVGLGAGSFAALAYSIHCPHNELGYIAIWYSVAVAAAAVLGRLIAAPFLRW